MRIGRWIPVTDTCGKWTVFDMALTTPDGQTTRGLATVGRIGYLDRKIKPVPANVLLYHDSDGALPGIETEMPGRRFLGVFAVPAISRQEDGTRIRLKRVGQAGSRRYREVDWHWRGPSTRLGTKIY